MYAETVDSGRQSLGGCLPNRGQAKAYYRGCKRAPEDASIWKWSDPAAPARRLPRRRLQQLYREIHPHLLEHGVPCFIDKA